MVFIFFFCRHFQLLDSILQGENKRCGLCDGHDGLSKTVYLRCFFLILNEKAVTCRRRMFCLQDAVVLCFWETPSPAD